jgi:hypothetical protein
MIALGLYLRIGASISVAGGELAKQTGSLAW